MLVSLAFPREPKRVWWLPEGVELGFQWQDGAIVLELPLLDIHDVLVVE